jgi:hypothetical protein
MGVVRQAVLDAALSGELQHKAYVSAADVDKYKHRLETVDTHYVEGRSS